MGPKHKPTHGRILRRTLPQPLIKDTLQPELGVPLLHVRHGRDLEQAVRRPCGVGRVQRRVAAADEDGGG